MVEARPSITTTTLPCPCPHILWAWAQPGPSLTESFLIFSLCIADEGGCRRMRVGDEDLRSITEMAPLMLTSFQPFWCLPLDTSDVLWHWGRCLCVCVCLWWRKIEEVERCADLGVVMWSWGENCTSKWCLCSWECRFHLCMYMKY